MKFEEVLPALREGKKIRMSFWAEERYIYFKYGFKAIDDKMQTYTFEWGDFICDNWEIVKEKKKVKLRDLTKRQYIKYCKKCNVRICNECPFHRVECDLKFDNCRFKNKDIYNNKFLDQEVEVEEE